MSGQGEKRGSAKLKEYNERVRKFQYTKIYKERNKSKDIGIDKPLEQSNRLKWPKSPHYFMVQSAKKLKPDHQFYNYFNYDRDQRGPSSLTEPSSSSKAEGNTTLEGGLGSESSQLDSRAVSPGALLTPGAALTPSLLTPLATVSASQAGSTEKSRVKAATNPFKKERTITSGPRRSMAGSLSVELLESEIIGGPKEEK